ncbi:MAG: NifB/NifX family molybdenum-iron cluster-binding protein [Chloroflexi bacterium]|nr:NifB/NifX family molybdenum-iron cluster-binding protein [Chloroflexota bacterium]
MVKKIAFPTDDGNTISPHLGQAQFFQVVTLDGDQMVHTEMIAKTQHHHHDAHPAEHDHPSAHPGQEMFAPLEGCQVLIAGGMGEPAFNRIQALGLEVYLTRQKNITLALEAYRAGQLDHDPRRIHVH